MHIFTIALLLLTTAFACGALAVHALQRRTYQDARILAALLIGATLVPASYAFDLLSTDMTVKVWLHSLYYVGAHLVALSSLLFALWYTGRFGWITWPKITWLFLPPFLALLFYLTDSWHHLHYARVWLDTSSFPPMRRSIPGPLYWINIVVSYGYLVSAFTLLARRLPRLQGVFQGQLIAILLAIAAPIVALAAYLAGLRPWGWLNITPFSFAVAGLAFAWAIWHMQLMDVRPIARELVIQRIPVGVIVLDALGRVVEVNAEAARFLSRDPDRIIGREFNQVAPKCPELLDLLSAEPGQLPVEVTLQWGTEARHYNAEVAPLGDPSHGVGHVLLVRDITRRMQAEHQRAALQRAAATQEERERLARQLHDGVGQVIGYLHMEARKASEFLSRGQPALAEAAVTYLSEVAADAHADLRDFVLGIPVDADAPRGFLPALQSYVRQVSVSYDLPIHLDVAESWSEDLIQPQAETQLLSIIKEALSNVHNHAAASQAEVVLSHEANRVRAVIRDNGRGFDLDRVMSGPGHVGLDIMQARAVKTGGMLQVMTTPGQGTQVIVELIAAQPGPVTGLANLRVLLADDHPLFREGLHTLLAARSIQVVGEAASGQEALEAVRLLQPTLVLLDLNMPGMDGFEALRQIRAEQPDLPVVILTVNESRDALQQAIRLGANGFLLKTLDANDFFRALERVVRGETPISPRLTDALLSQLAGDQISSDNSSQESPLDTLTPRQREILSLIAQDLPYKTIARDLCLSEPTIKYHVAKILERLGVDTRAQAVDLLRRHDR